MSFDVMMIKIEPSRDETNKMACAPSGDSNQPGHPLSLIRVFAVFMKKAWVLSYQLRAQRRLWSDWADTQADLNVRWPHSHFVGLVTRRLSCSFHYSAASYLSNYWSRNICTCKSQRICLHVDSPWVGSSSGRNLWGCCWWDTHSWSECIIE